MRLDLVKRPMFLICLVLLVGCTSSHRADSESHFLSSCDQSCGEGLTCICGVCTAICDDSSDCTRHALNATCVPFADAPADLRCAERRSLAACDFGCTSDKACADLGVGYVCQSGFCRERGFQLKEPTAEDGGRLDADSDMDARTASEEGGSVGMDSSDFGNQTEGSVEGGKDAPPFSALNASLVCQSYINSDSDSDAGVDHTDHGSGGGQDVVPSCAQLAGSDPIEGALAVATGDDETMFVTLYEAQMYWNRGTAILSAGKNGSDPVQLSEADTPTALIADESSVYWIRTPNGDDLYVEKAPRDGGPAIRLAEEAGSNDGGFAADEQYIYWVGQTSDECILYRTPKQVGPTTVLLNMQRCTPYWRGPELMVYGDNLYWLMESSSGEASDGALLTMPKDGEGPATVLVSDLASPVSLAVDDTYLYWANWGTIDALENNNRDGSIMRMALGGSRPEILVDGLNQPFRIAVDASFVYWLQIDDNAASRSLSGLLARAATDCSTPPATMANGLGNPWGLVANDGEVYWIDYCDENHDSVVMKISR